MSKAKAKAAKTTTRFGPYTEDAADEVVKEYRVIGYSATKKPQKGEEGQFMVVVQPK